jgi:hypothetical protein
MLWLRRVLFTQHARATSTAVKCRSGDDCRLPEYQFWCSFLRFRRWVLFATSDSSNYSRKSVIRWCYQSL